MNDETMDATRDHPSGGSMVVGEDGARDRA